jgi:electron transfer flavoprotein alpha subunit
VFAGGFQSAAVVLDEIPTSRSRIEDLGTLPARADSLPLEEAPVVLSGGAGVKDWSMFDAAAKALQATRAGTRVACDLGHLPRDRQVGASGRITRAEVYLAFGLSGAAQHLQGIEGCRKVIAVNQDPYAPIFKRADLGATADADAVLAALLRRLGGPR